MTLTFAHQPSDRGALRAFTRWLRRLIAEGAHALHYIVSIDRGDFWGDRRVHLHAFLDGVDRVTPDHAAEYWTAGIPGIESAFGEGARRYVARKCARGDGWDGEGTAKLVIQDAIRATLTDEPSSILQIALRLRPNTPEGDRLFKVPAPVIAKHLRRMVATGVVIPIPNENGRTLWALRGCA